MSDELREQLASEQHGIWAHWMRYLFSRCRWDATNGNAIIPADLVERWQRQMDAPYDTLSDKERESDRHQADKVLGVVRADLAAAIQRAEAAETALAAAPLDALRVTVELARVTLLHRTDRGVSTDAAAVAAAARWLAERGEGQS